MKIITFVNTATEPSYGGTTTYNVYTSAVLPISCSLKSMGHLDINDKILIQQSSAARDLSNLLTKTEKRIAEILKVEDGQFRIDKSALPDGYFEPDIPAGSAEPLIELSEPSTSEKGVNTEILHELIENEEKEKDTELEAEGLPEEETQHPRRSHPTVYTSRSFVSRPITTLPTTPMLDSTPPSRHHPAGESHARQPVYPYDTDGTSRAEVGVGIGLSAQADREMPRNGSSITGYESSDLESVFTPSVSAASDTTTTPGLDFETGGITDTAAEMSRDRIRAEVGLILGTFFGGLAEQMKEGSFGG
ncbi:hypothetical protein Q9L58_008256 [Maublancomyces gigas]|uniref:Uncharacterized protein n=1 Tax=Discina gigas TaxID=1032678 RepID=A0ABR3GAI5_9PEZI